MRQILTVVDEMEVNMSTIDFACFIANLTKSTLVPVMMSKKRKHIVDLVDAGARADIATLTLRTRGETIVINRRLIRQACSNRGVDIQFVKDDSYEFDELIKESRYSDLVIADQSISDEERLEGGPTAFLKQLLERTECPVIVAPHSLDSIEEIIFAYDGGKSAMFAIRQFTYLFPELTHIKLTVAQVCDPDDMLFTEKERLVQWINRYYQNVDYRLLYGSPKSELFGYLLERKNKLVIMGAFGRTMLPLLSSNSSAELILKAVNLPVFISHT